MPIYIYGHAVLRKKTEPVPEKYPQLKQLICDMYETMYNAKGVGLAAPQIGKSIQLFIVDATPMSDEDFACNNFKEVFINPVINKYFGENIAFTEGCLSIPDIRENVERKTHISISYYDRNWNFKENIIYDGWISRIIQHEYDHLKGILFTDKIYMLRRKLLSNKLQGIAKGKFDHTYRFVLRS